MAKPTIGIIGGTGWLGSAIARSMLKAGFLEPSQLILSSRSTAHGLTGWPDVTCTADNQELAARADVIILSVRPDQFSAVEIDARGKLVISVMAGVPITTLAERTNSDRIVRAMPNAAAEIGKSYTPWFASDGAEVEDKELVRRLFETCGSTDEVFREADIDYLTALTGSGPAFPALLAQAMIGHALDKGLPRDIATRAATAVVAGASQLLGVHYVSPEETVRAFLDYRGTTAAGLQGMIDGGFIAAVGAGLDAAEAAATAMSRTG
ncbi:pyrroline-5-carboxylate reductase family protein [Pseudaminobacter soli (ex Li et al. 2025)]|uniref:Pyrroline-5-carboxylate reductase n=1 Tax=Pseudaminobacter soli (ex Li et al. 2025) TaxID=1295366 RepID=A0A2P7SKL5_9HYPH|nr:pyrroline-5-carboxylate reductase dimerization domain-containing protein [Mesorhizobium soli]PSJ63024.1 pyrroline-5-carboxylate reductase [Mesorhizobium soli]